ncbi:hypothetical protein IG631_22012 [Alternaria alternata]|nr:hypothetical protein IG631_22012 [Alternaria alternata]
MRQGRIVFPPPLNEQCDASIALLSTCLLHTYPESQRRDLQQHRHDPSTLPSRFWPADCRQSPIYAAMWLKWHPSNSNNNNNKARFELRTHSESAFEHTF